MKVVIFFDPWRVAERVESRRKKRAWKTWKGSKKRLLHSEEEMHVLQLF